MSGDLGFWEVKPDQMQVINPLLILIFIPLYEVLFYPLLNLIGIRRPLQKLTLGGILAGISFVVSAIVEINLSKTYAVTPIPGEAQLRIFNGKACDYTFSSNITDHPTFSIPAMQNVQYESVKINGASQNFEFAITAATPANCAQDIGYTVNFALPEEFAKTFFLRGDSTAQVRHVDFEDSPDKSRRGWPFIRILANIHSNADVKLLEKGKDERYNEKREHVDQVDVPGSKEYEVFIGDRSIRKDLELRLGGVYTLTINEQGPNDFTTELAIISDPNSMKMFWLIPQYVIMTLGEVSTDR